VGLKVTQGELLHGEPIAECPGEVCEVELDPVERGLLQASVPMSGKILVPQLGQRQRTALRGFVRDLAIKLLAVCLPFR
jgi:hypothetical protein